jgi:sigma-B regulation protein RsbU (phosphoserine phosphatase)
MNIEEIISGYLRSDDLKSPHLSALTFQLLEYWAATQDFEIDNRLLRDLVFKYAASEKKLKELNKDLIWKQERLEEDLAAAADIQSSLLPKNVNDIGRMAVAWKFKPCEKIGGDIFNLAQLDDRHWGIYMLDVSGHGVPAAMVAVSVFQNLHPQAGRILLKSTDAQNRRAMRSPARVLEKLDLEYTFDRFNNFFTINYVILDTATGDFTCSSAGHPPPIIIRQDGSIDLMTSGSPPIGTRDLRLVEESVTFPEEKMKLNPGDKLVLYTDGVFEYQNRKGEFYGNRRFHQQLAKLKDVSVDALVKRQFQALMDFGNSTEPKDDISLLGIELN